MNKMKMNEELQYKSSGTFEVFQPVPHIVNDSVSVNHGSVVYY